MSGLVCVYIALCVNESFQLDEKLHRVDRFCYCDIRVGFVRVWQ